VWRACPVPAALLGRDGAVVARSGPDSGIAFELESALPAPGHVVRTRSRDGTDVALAGVPRGALAIALPADAVARRRDRILADLGSRLAHDINTPLSALNGHLDLIAHEPISPAAQESVRTCQRELTRLQTTAQDLLDFTRLRSGGGRRTRKLAGALAEEAAAALLDAADAAGVELVVVVPTEPAAVDATESDVVRALRNLLSNALCHGLGEERKVSLNLESERDAVTFAVADSGPGMTPEELEQLSQPFVRGPGSGQGSGLGLTIAAEVAAAHGSHLVAGRGPDGRPRVSFTLRRVP
jgi:signal transduction histidine kinase